MQTEISLEVNTLTIILFVVMVSILSWIYNYFTIGYDSTDNPIAKERSNLTLYTDHATGLQYIRGGIFGGLQPRLNTDGTHRTITQDLKEPHD